MREVIINPICSGVEGCYIKATKFKTSRISINFYLPLKKETVSANALLTALLTRASKEFPNLTLLSQKLASLYGASLYSDSLKIGDMQILRFVIASLDNKYTLEKEDVSAQATSLLLSMIFEPPLENDLFKQEDFESEKRLLIEAIEAEINDKRKYALAKTEAILFENEPAGISKYGTVGDVLSLTNEDVVKAWQALLKTAFVRVNAVSASEPYKIFDKIKESFSSLERQVEKVNFTKKHISSSEVKAKEEKMDVTQGKLCMAFSVDNQDASATAMVFTDLFGGSPHSKLFTNVREKQGLCYYCAARYNSQKNVIIVDSGILEENKTKAYDSILEQLEEIKKGNITEDNLNASILSISDALQTVIDMPANLDLSYVNRAFTDETIEEYAAKINNVKLTDIIEFAKGVKLDTVYFLNSDKKEGEA